VQQYSGRQKVGKGEEADLKKTWQDTLRDDLQGWMSAGRRRPSLLLVTARSGEPSSPNVPVGT